MGACVNNRWWLHRHVLHMTANLSWYVEHRWESSLWPNVFRCFLHFESIELIEIRFKKGDEGLCSTGSSEPAMSVTDSQDTDHEN